MTTALWPDCIVRRYDGTADLDRAIGPFALCNSFNLLMLARTVALGVLTVYTWEGYQTEVSTRGYPVDLTLAMMGYYASFTAEIRFVSGACS